MGTLLLIVASVTGLWAALWASGLLWLARRVAAACPPEGGFLETRAGRLHYVDQGRGPAILLLHGLGGQSRHFTHSISARLSPTFRVIALDRPGAGHSGLRRHCSLGLDNQADVMAEVITALGLTHPLVVGHSMGGAIALATAQRRPDLVGGLVLIAPFSQVEEKVPGPFRALPVRNPVLRVLIGWTLAVPLSIHRRRTTLDTVFGPQRPPPDFAVRGGGLLSLRPGAFITASAELCAAGTDMAALVAGYGRMRMPVGLVHGDSDRVLDLERHGRQTSREIPGADLRIVPGGGHMLPITAPGPVVDLIRATALRVRSGPEDLARRP